MIKRDQFWDTMMVIRDGSTWTGNRSEISVGGVTYMTQRALRENRKRLGSRTGHTLVWRADGGWKVTVKHFNLQDITREQDAHVRNPNFHQARREMWASNYATAELEFEGDLEQFEQDCVFLKMFT